MCNKLVDYQKFGHIMKNQGDGMEWQERLGYKMRVRHE